MKRINVHISDVIFKNLQVLSTATGLSISTLCSNFICLHVVNNMFSQEEICSLLDHTYENDTDSSNEET